MEPMPNTPYFIDLGVSGLNIITIDPWITLSSRLCCEGEYGARLAAWWRKLERTRKRNVFMLLYNSNSSAIWQLIIAAWIQLTQLTDSPAYPNPLIRSTGRPNTTDLLYSSISSHVYSPSQAPTSNN